MLRRFETYGFAPHATPDDQADLAAVLRRSPTFVPEILDSAVGRNRSATGVDLVWEHAYADPESYARYMRHPFHICVLDRYLLPEHPECITSSRRELQLGLLGYEVDGAPFRAEGSGVRRIVAMRAAPDASTDAVDAFLASLSARAASRPDVDVSVAAPNTMGLEWFPDGWTHLWEQAFHDEATMRATLDEEQSLLTNGPLAAWIDVWYEIERDDGGTTAPEAAHVAADAAADSWLVLDEVVVDPGDTDAYLDAFRRLYLPGATRRGLELVACWHTPVGIGEPVTVATVLAIGTWADWELARNAAVRDPALPEWIRTRAALMRRGTRRFLTAPPTPDP